MLSDEEKKAIESLIEIREFANLSSYKDTKISQLNAIDVVLNLIKKQSKEIEEYKKQLDLDYVDKHFVPIERYNQLKKEIEELKKQLDLDNECEIALNNRIMDLENADKKWADKIKAKIEEVKDGIYDAKIVLQSLLEKE